MKKKEEKYAEGSTQKREKDSYAPGSLSPAFSVEKERMPLLLVCGVDFFSPKKKIKSMFLKLWVLDSYQVVLHRISTWVSHHERL